MWADWAEGLQSYVLAAREAVGSCLCLLRALHGHLRAWEPVSAATRSWAMPDRLDKDPAASASAARVPTSPGALARGCGHSSQACQEACHSTVHGPTPRRLVAGWNRHLAAEGELQHAAADPGRLGVIVAYPHQSSPTVLQYLRTAPMTHKTSHRGMTYEVSGLPGALLSFHQRY